MPAPGKPLPRARVRTGHYVGLRRGKTLGVHRGMLPSFGNRQKGRLLAFLATLMRCGYLDTPRRPRTRQKRTGGARSAARSPHTGTKKPPRSKGGWWWRRLGQPSRASPSPYSRKPAQTINQTAVTMKSPFFTTQPPQWRLRASLRCRARENRR